MEGSSSDNEKHVPMQQQADFQPITYSMGEDFPVKSSGLFFGCSGPGPEIVRFPAGPNGTNFDLAAIPVRFSPFIPPGKAVFSDGKTIKVFDLPEEAEKAEKE
jgi:hypothetical protein